MWERYVASKRLEACLHGPLQQHLWISQWKPMRGMSQFKGAQLKLAKYQMDSNGTCLCVCVWLCVTIKKSTITTSRVSSSPYGVHGISNHHTNPELRQFMQCSFKFGKPADLAGSHGDTVMECYGMLAIFVKPDSPELITNIKLITNINIQTIYHEILNWGHLRWLWLTKILSLSGELRGGLFGSARGGGTTAWQTAWRNPGNMQTKRYENWWYKGPPVTPYFHDVWCLLWLGFQITVEPRLNIRDFSLHQAVLLGTESAHLISIQNGKCWKVGGIQSSSLSTTPKLKLLQV